MEDIVIFLVCLLKGAIGEESSVVEERVGVRGQEEAEVGDVDGGVAAFVEVVEGEVGRLLEEEPYLEFLGII